jgi:hypothetical protein
MGGFHLFTTTGGERGNKGQVMVTKLPKRGLPPVRPGELLHEEVLPAPHRPKVEIAKLLGGRGMVRR